MQFSGLKNTENQGLVCAFDIVFVQFDVLVIGFDGVPPAGKAAVVEREGNGGKSKPDNSALTNVIPELELGLRFSLCIQELSKAIFDRWGL